MKLKIKNNKIKIQEELKLEKNNLNEDATEDSSLIGKMSGGKGIFKAIKDTSKFVKDTTFKIYKVFGSAIRNIWSKNGSLEDFAKRVNDIEKHFMQETNKAIQSLDNTTRQMVQEAGLDENNIDMILSAGLPIVGIVNSIQTKAYNPNPFENKTYIEGEKVFEVILANIVNIYAAGEQNSKDIIYNSEAIRAIKNEITESIGKKFLEWLESLDNKKALDRNDKLIIQKITDLSSIATLRDLKSANLKKANQISNNIRTVYMRVAGVKESKATLKILSNKIHQETLLEKSMEVDQSQAIRLLDLMLKALSFSLVFKQSIIKAIFKNLNKISTKIYNTLQTDLTTFVHMILIYESHKDVINYYENHIDDFKEDVYTKTLKSKLEEVKNYMQDESRKSIEENSSKFTIEVDENNKLESFSAYCNTVILIFTNDFSEGKIKSVADKYYENIKKYIDSIAKDAGIEKDALLDNINNDVIKLYEYLNKNKEKLNAKDDIATISNIIKKLNKKNSEESNSDQSDANANTGDSDTSDANISDSAEEA